MSIYDFDSDFSHYEHADKKERQKLGQIWTQYDTIAKMMDKWPRENWKDPSKTSEAATMLDPTMGAGNIVIAMLYRRIVEHGQDPITALKNTYGVELDPPTHRYAQQRIIRFMKNFTEEDVTEIVKHNFVNSDIFEWNLEEWRAKKPEELSREREEQERAKRAAKSYARKQKSSQAE